MNRTFQDLLKEKIIVFDGAMGTNIQRLNLSEDDFGGKEGCNEYLVLTRPDVIGGIHESFLRVGCDVVETDSFGANRIVLAEYGLADRAVEINQKAAKIAKEAALQYSTKGHPRFVAGSIGPGTKLPSLGHILFDELKDVTKEQIHGLVLGGVDILIIETCQDLLQIKSAIVAAEEYFAEKNIRLPLMVQVTFETTGTMLLGSDMAAVIATLEMFPLDVIGMNCATGPSEMADHLRYLCENSSKPVSALPNAGLPENVGGRPHYKLTPEEFADHHERFVKEFGVSVVGGCCGTTAEHLKAVVERVGKLTPKRRMPKHEPSCASLYGAVSYQQEPRPLLVGEQTNANGSRKFRQLLEQNDYDGLVGMAREAAKEGAHLVDVCVAFTGRDEIQDVKETLSRMNRHVAVPIMIDSTEAPVIEEALKRIGGKAMINSINLEDGEERMQKICPLARKFGAGLVALTIDETGMAKTHQKKFEIAKRIYDLATQKYGIRGEDLFFDALTFTLASGDEELRNAAGETLEAIRWIKKNLPGANTILGVSNISFGLAPHARQILNSLFLHEAVAAGLDAAIVHAKKILPIFKIPKEDLEVARRLLFNEWIDGTNPLHALIAYFDQKQGGDAARVVAKKAETIEEILKAKILDGSKENLEGDLEEALKKYAPVDIINQILLEAMKLVGELFGSGKMQLPFVLQSAEVMKHAVAYLERYMPKSAGQEKGKIVLATVKGDVHDIGKNLVDIILTNNGYKVINLGIKQPIDNILKAALENQADAIGLSGLLVKSTYVMKQDLEELNTRGVQIPVICGGAALTPKYVEQDLAQSYGGKVFYGKDAFSGLRIMDEITYPKQDSIVKAQKKTVKSDGKSKGPSGAAPCEVPISHTGKAAMLHPVPKPPFLGYRILKNIRLEDIFPWVNQTALFRGQWQYRRGEMPPADYEKLLREKVEPLWQEWTARSIREKILEPLAIYGFYPCYSEGNDLIVLDESAKKEKVRFQFPRQKQEPFKCISDYFRSKESGELDVLGVQVVTVGKRASEIEQVYFQSDKYAEYFHLHGLSVETAEGLAEYVHALVRRDLAIHQADRPSKAEIFAQGYQGSRYSFGYPACPALEDQAKLFKLVPAEKIGVTLSEELQMIPEQSTSAIVVHHPEAKYFSV